jgi:hypothetical protein
LERDPRARPARRAVIVSDEAGQFRVSDHALCWVYAERLVQKLIPATALQENAIEVFKRMVWWFYGRLKAFSVSPRPAPSSGCLSSTTSATG